MAYNDVQEYDDDNNNFEYEGYDGEEELPSPDENFPENDLDIY